MALAKSEIEKAVDEAKERIKGEKQAAFDSLKQEMAHLVAAATTKVASGMNEKDQRSLIDQAIKETERI
jgi:F0F1-type ATP synthase membrane subunit b/b'